MQKIIILKHQPHFFKPKTEHTIFHHRTRTNNDVNLCRNLLKPYRLSNIWQKRHLTFFPYILVDTFLRREGTHLLPSLLLLNTIVWPIAAHNPHATFVGHILAIYTPAIANQIRNASAYSQEESILVTCLREASIHAW